MNEVVQIGDTVFDLVSGNRFKANRKGLSAKWLDGRVYDVPDKSWASARLAVKKDAEAEQQKKGRREIGD
jgi:hypothetical protein